MQSRVPILLEGIYGREEAPALAKRFEELVRRFRSSAPRSSAVGPICASEKDAVLITYADQMRETGRAPLATLHDFLRRQIHPWIKGVHLLPFYPSTSDDGFSVADYFRIDPALGDWDDVKMFGRDFRLMFDAVFNHASSQNEWFKGFLGGDPAYAEFFVTVEGDPDLRQVVRPRALPLLTTFESHRGPARLWTTFSADQLDLNVRNPNVLLRLTEALFFYVQQGAGLIRLDAIAYLWKDIGTPCIHLPQTHQIIQLWRALLDEWAPDVLLVTETNVPHCDNISYFGDGTNEAQMVYNFALPPLVLHSFITANAVALTDWAATLKTPSNRTTFFNFLASHDGIGVNPARGILSASHIDALVERVKAHGGLVSYKSMPDGSDVPYELNISYFDALSNPGASEALPVQVDRFMAAHGILMALAGVPGIYFHSLFGSRSDRAAAEISRIPRRINRAKCEREALERELSDSNTLRQQVLARFRNLMKVRTESRAFHPLAPQEVLTIHPAVFALRRGQADESVLCLHNVSPRQIQLNLGGLGFAKPPRNLLEDGRLLPSGTTITLEPFEVLWIGN